MSKNKKFCWIDNPEIERCSGRNRVSLTRGGVTCKRCLRWLATE